MEVVVYPVLPTVTVGFRYVQVTWRQLFTVTELKITETIFGTRRTADDSRNL